MLSLHSLLSSARGHPLYRDWDLTEGLSPGRDAWERLPLLTAEEIRAVCVGAGTPGGDIVYSSGTTGAPKTLHLSPDDQRRIIQLCARFCGVEGVGPVDRTLVLLPMGLWNVGRITVGGLLAAGSTVRPVDLHGDAVAWTAFAEDFKPTVISSTPSVLMTWAREFDAPWQGLRCVETTGEPLLADERFHIERAFGAPVYDAYGLTECVVGVECHEHLGFHYWPDACHVEIIDPVTLRPVPKGGQGEIVLTSFMQEFMPVVRYRSGDLGRLLPYACQCGRSQPLLLVEGRLASTYEFPRAVHLDHEELQRAVESIAPGARIRVKDRPGSPATQCPALHFVPTLEVLVDNRTDDARRIQKAIEHCWPHVYELVREGLLKIVVGAADGTDGEQRES